MTHYPTMYYALFQGPIAKTNAGFMNTTLTTNNTCVDAYSHRRMTTIDGTPNDDFVYFKTRSTPATEINENFSFKMLNIKALINTNSIFNHS